MNSNYFYDVEDYKLMNRFFLSDKYYSTEKGAYKATEKFLQDFHKLHYNLY